MLRPTDAAVGDRVRAADSFRPIAEALGEGLEATVRFYEGWQDAWDLRAQVSLAMRRSLWGNRADLSNITVKASSETDSDEQHRILIDHRAIIWDLLSAGRVRRLDFVADNSGPEILADMDARRLMVRQLAHAMLERQGYRVLVAKNATDALAQLEQHGATVAQGRAQLAPGGD